MDSLAPYRTPSPLEPQMIGDNFMSWASSGRSVEDKYFAKWPFRFCLGDWSTSLYKYTNEFEAWLASCIKLPFILLFTCLGAREEAVVTDVSFGYTPLMRAKKKYNKAVHCFNKVKNYPSEIDRYEDLTAFRNTLLNYDWHAAMGVLNEKDIKELEKNILAFEARYYPKALI